MNGFSHETRSDTGLVLIRTRFDVEAKGDSKVAYWCNVCYSLTVKHLPAKLRVEG